MTDAVQTRSKCGAKTRAGSPCQQPAGWGTDHAGQGRCKLHGGATPIKTGRYSVIEREDLRELTEHFAADDDPLDVLPELAKVRGLLTQFINEYEEIADALLAWNAEENQKEHPRPQRLPELSEAIGFLKTATKIAQDEKRLRVQNAVSRSDLLRVLSEMARALERRINDPDTLAKIKDDWAEIRLG